MSDKTTAALAAEQADAEATTTQEPELLPAATLDELEQVDLGTVAEGERAPFRNLGKRPAVTVVDSAGTVVIGEVDYLDDNTVRLTFCAAFSGTAYFN